MGAADHERWLRLLGAVRGWSIEEDRLVLRFAASGGVRRQVRALVADSAEEGGERSARTEQEGASDLPSIEVREGGPGLLEVELRGAADLRATLAGRLPTG